MDVIEADHAPILHIDIIHVLRQRMLVKSPINSRYPMSENVVLIRLILLQYIAHLFTEFPQISRHEMMVAMQKRHLLCFSHRSNDSCLNIC